MTKPTTTPELTALVDAASTALERARAVEPGQLFDQVDHDALSAIAVAHQTAGAIVFPTGVVPVGADVLADLAEYTAGLARADYTAGLLVLHHEALATYPALHEALRGRVGHNRVAANAVALAPSFAREGGDVVEEEIERFDRGLAGQLVAANHEQAPAAKAFLRILELRDELAEIRQRHLDFAKAETARIDAERRAKAEAAAAAEQAERVALGHYFRSHGADLFAVGARSWTGYALVAIAANTYATDADGRGGGDGYKVPTLADLKLARKRAEASAAITE